MRAAIFYGVVVETLPINWLEVYAERVFDLALPDISDFKLYVAYKTRLESIKEDLEVDVIHDTSKVLIFWRDTLQVTEEAAQANFFHCTLDRDAVIKKFLFDMGLEDQLPQWHICLLKSGLTSGDSDPS
jgi:hypothetical protein